MYVLLSAVWTSHSASVSYHPGEAQQARGEVISIW